MMKIGGNVLYGVGRIHINREGAPVHHDAFVNPGELRSRAGRDETPVVFNTRTEKQPVPPGNMVDEQQHRPVGPQYLLVERAIPVKHAQNESKERDQHAGISLGRGAAPWNQ